MALSLFHLSDSFCLGRAGEKLKGLTSVESLLYKVHWKKKNASGFTWNIWGRCVSCLEAANIPSTCLSLGAVAWHCRIWVGMGLRNRSKCRCDAPGDHLQFSAGFRNFGLIPGTGSAWLALANCCLLKGLSALFFCLLLPFWALGFWKSGTFLFLNSNQELLQPLPIEVKGLWCSLSSPAHSGKLQHRKMWAT